MNRRPPAGSLILVLMIIPVLFSLLGCGIGGSGGSPPESAFEARLVPGKMTQEGSDDLDVLYASIKGTGITGGWLETQQGTKIPGSDLLFESLTGRYEVLLTRPVDGFPAGEYKLKYTESGTTKEFKAGQLAWAALIRFPSSPTLSWDGLTRTLRVQYNSIPGANVAYFLRVYNPDSGFLRKETYPSSGNEIREFLPETGNLQVMLVGDVLEGGTLKARILHFFQEKRF